MVERLTKLSEGMDNVSWLPEEPHSASSSDHPLVKLLIQLKRVKHAESYVRVGLTARLYLAFYDIGDCGAEIVAAMLKHNTTVERVYLRRCGIGPLGVKAIAEALLHNTTVELLNLACNTIGVEGADALIATLHRNVCLRDMYLYRVDISPEAKESIQYLVETRNAILIPEAVRRASLCLIAARRTIASAGALSILPKEIVKMIAIQVWATRKEPIWLNALTESERTGRQVDK